MADSPKSDPLIGQVFAERYKIRSRVARGSMGRVYQAEQMPLGRSVAVKLLDVSMQGGGTEDDGPRRYEERFLREASLLAKLSHPNTVRVYDYGVEDKQSFLVMEYVEGPTLRKLMKDGPLDPLRAVRLGRQICGSLREAHELGLIHRDLKPANVLVTRGADGEDMVKVVDFGLVKEVEDAVHMTGEGLMLGTPMYMAPEQIRGRNLDQRCDIYALGILLYRALTGCHPFDEGQAAAVLMAHLTDPVPPFAEAAPDLDVPACLEWTVLRCLEKECDDRFSAVRELQRALKVSEAALLDEATASCELKLVGGELVLPDAIYTGGTPAVQPRTRRSALPLGVGALVVGASAILALVFGYVAIRGVFAALSSGAPVAEEIAAPLQPAPAPVVVTPEDAAGDNEDAVDPDGQDPTGQADSDPIDLVGDEGDDAEHDGGDEPPEPANASVMPVPAAPAPAPVARPRPRPRPRPAPASVSTPEREPVRTISEESSAATAAAERESIEVQSSDLLDPWDEK